MLPGPASRCSRTDRPCGVARFRQTGSGIRQLLLWVNMVHELDLLELAAAWRSEGRCVALATVVATWGSSPRPPGSQLLADDSGRFMGSVSGGCIEGEV